MNEIKKIDPEEFLYQEALMSEFPNICLILLKSIDDSKSESEEVLQIQKTVKRDDQKKVQIYKYMNQMILDKKVAFYFKTFSDSFATAQGLD